jgi:F5/8 type C domain/PEP-CTERM motif
MNKTVVAAICAGFLAVGSAHAATNVALTGTASQSSLWGGTTTAVAGAAKAIDGDTNGNWTGLAGTNSLNHTDNEAGNGVGTGFAWWEVALTADFKIENVVIWNRTDTGIDRLRNFTVTVLNNGASLVSITFAGATGPTPSYTAAFNTPFFGTVVGDTVRVQLTEQNYLHLAEVQVMATPVPEASTLAMMLAGLGLTAAAARRRRAA